VNFNAITGGLSTPNVFTVDPDFENPYTDRVTIGAERELLPKISVGLDVTYAKGHQLQRLTDINRVYDGTTAANGLPRYSSTRRFPAYGAIITDLSDGESKYRAATLTVQRRYADNFAIFAGVTYSKDEDNDSNERNFSGIQAEDYNNLDLNWGPSARDQRWKAGVNGVWDTPLWGIGVSGVFKYYSGQPYNVTAGAELNNDAVSGTDRPTINGVHFHRNSGRQPSFYQLDLRISKKFGVGPTDISVFAECFNCSNRTNTFIGPNNTIWGTAQTPRATFGVEDSFNSQYSPRTVQFGFRFEF
jgi:hypothetical protein